MIRILTFIIGLGGATGLSQFPEFSQQYLQRLAGAVDELSRVVTDFDASAQSAGLSRQEALSQMGGTTFQDAHKADTEKTITRFERLSGDLKALRDAPMVVRALQPQRFTDPEIAAAAWSDFKPAMPVTVTGFGFAAVGFVLGVGLTWPLFWLMGWPLRALRRPAAPRRQPPPLTAADQAVGVQTSGMDLFDAVLENHEPRRVVAQGGQMQVTALCVAPRAQMGGHLAQEGDMTLCALAGEGRITWSGHEALLAPGALVIVPAGAIYEIGNDGHEPLQLFATEPRTAHGLRAVPVARQIR